MVTGAAIGGGLGVVVATTTDDICSPATCAVLLAVAGGAVGRLVDGAIGKPAPVVPGRLVDDSVWNGAFIGAGAGSGVLLIDLSRHCGKGHGRVQCTVPGTLDKLWKAALFSAAVGAVADAAIPTRAPGGTTSMPAGSRRLGLSFSACF